MKKTVAGVLVVLGMFLTPGAAVAGLPESTWSGCFPLRSSGMFAHLCLLCGRCWCGWCRSCFMARLSKLMKKMETTRARY